VELDFRSILPVRYLQDVEQLVFFNERQRDLRRRIVELLEQYGPLEIVQEEGHLRVGLVQRPDAQNLFVLSGDTQDAELLGFALYLRDSPDVITVVHVAVFDGIVTEEGSDPLLALRLLYSIRELARRIRGVKWVSVLYGQGSQARLPVLSSVCSDKSRMIEPDIRNCQ
jgi:hypothetical protein